MNILSRIWCLIAFIYIPEQKFFGELEDRQIEFGIEDIGMGLTTLEEVLRNIEKKAELESLESLILASGIVVQVSKVYLSYI